MKKLLVIALSIFLTIPLFASKIEEMIDSTEIMQQKLGVNQASREKALEPKIIELFKNKDTNLEVRMVAARTLGAYKTDNSLNALLEVISDDSEDLQSAIISSLVKYSDKEKAVDAIINSLKNGKTEFVRSISAQSLASIKTDKVVTALIEALDDDSVLVKQKAANSLGEIGDKRAIPALKRVYKEEDDPNLKSYTFSALKKMGGIKVETKSTTTALLLGLTPINGLGLWYADKKLLAIADLTVQAASVAMIIYGVDSFNQKDSTGAYKDAGKHYSFLGGVVLFSAGYILDIVLPVMAVSKYNERNESDSVYNFTPVIFTDGKTTVAGFNLDF